MSRRTVGRVITGLAAIGFLGTAALHTSGYNGVVTRAAQAPEAIRPLISMLWLAFSFDFTILGLIVAVLAAKPSPVTRLILGITAIAPIAAAGLQLRFIGFIQPTSILIAVAVVTLLGAAILPATGSGMNDVRSSSTTE